MPFIRCPSCNARYKVGADAGGRSAKCQKCGRGFKIPTFERHAPPEEELRLTSLDALDSGTPIELERPPQSAAVGAGTGPLAEAEPVTGTTTYSAAPVGAVAGSGGRPYTAYFHSLGQSLAFPSRVGDFITFGIVWVILIVGEFVGRAGGCLGLVGSLIVAGWYMSFQLNVVVGAAGAEEDLPTLTLTEGWWDDIVSPFFKMLATYVGVHLPAVIFLASVGMLRTALGATGAGGGALALLQALDVPTLVVGGLLLLAGYALWPMLVLIVAVGSVLGFVRVDLIARTILKSFPAYLLTLLIVYLSVGSGFGIAILVGIAVQFPAGAFGGTTAMFTVMPLLKIVQLFFTIIAMRAIGSYYCHFKHKFAWSWG